MPTSDYDALTAAAFHKERVLARRLATRSGLTPAEALRQVMTQAAGAPGLASLLAQRAQAQAAEAARRAARAQEKIDTLALRRARDQPPPGAWLAWFDGSAHPNPGRLGIGALLRGPAGECVEISRRAGHGNSGEAEYLALIALLETALRHRPPQLAIYGDSQVVVNDVNRPPATAGAAGLQAHHARAIGLMAQLPEVALRWIPRHRNADADRLSQQAIASWPQADHEDADDTDDNDNDHADPAL
ncbi:ribonuclease HI family protein [Rugamonas sp.]|uniref:ribonuclease HI family protein n=1 Tax=Rugamonas sp. TaxID=1926287 RepID=UPI0025E33C71|nr:ribonuclease HI family protein [Rugamonas sp.]